MPLSQKPKWSPYVAGMLSGVLLTVSVAISQIYFGSSLGYIRAAGLMERLFSPAAADGTSLYAHFFGPASGLDWQTVFILGILVGSLFSSLADGSFRLLAVPYRWRERFGPNWIKRWLAAFAGGFVIIFGTLLAGGCPTGHGLSGLGQLSASSAVSMLTYLIVGILAARALYRSR